MTAPYRDPRNLRRLYCERGLSLAETADELGCGRETVRKWMERYGIERRAQNAEGRNHPNWQERATFTHDGGYEVWKNGAYGGEVLVHRLLAVAEHGFDAVCGRHVHHEKPIPWLNTPENLEVLDPSDHSSLHAQERSDEMAEIARQYAQKRPRNEQGDFVATDGGTAENGSGGESA